MAPIFITTTGTPSSASLETPAIIVICVCCYLVILTILVFVRQCCVASGHCTDCKDICGTANDQNNCCDCWIAVAQACDCGIPGTKACCDSLCGPRRHCDIGDCFAAVCVGPPECCEKGCSSPECSCGCCDCPANTIKCDKPDCGEIACLCFTISCREGGPTQQQQVPPPPHQYPYPPYDPQGGGAYPYSHPYPGTSSFPGHPGEYHDSSRVPYGYYPATGSFRGQGLPVSTQPASGQFPNTPPANLFRTSSRGYQSTRQGYETSRNF